MNKKRLLHYDLLRIIAIFCVVILHVTGPPWRNIPVNTFEWQSANVYNGLMWFCVPVLVMISGCFFLKPDKTIPVKTLYGKYVFRMVRALVVWSFIYVVANIILTNETVTYRIVFDLVFRLFPGSYHFWYIYMIIGLYMIVPFLQKITKDKKLMQYFLLLNLIFSFLLPLILKLPYMSALSSSIDDMFLYFPLGYSGYFVAGYYFNTVKIKKKIKVCIYIAGIVSAILIVLLTSVSSIKENTYVESFHDYLTPLILLFSVGLFLFFKEEVSKISFRENTQNIIVKISGLTFTVYLVHQLIITVLQNFGMYKMLSQPIYAVPIISVIVFACSLLIAFVISKIPFLNKYIV